MLLATKLRALVTSGFGEIPITAAGGFGDGAALVAGRSAYVMRGESEHRMLGPALAWAGRHGATGVHLLVQDRESAGHLARRARLFNHPIAVWSINGRDLDPVTPIGVGGHQPPSPAAVELSALVTRAGARVCIEHGVVTGELLGLEIARVVQEPSGGGVRIEVGVGAHDREAFRILHGEMPSEEALRDVVQTVSRYRQAGAEPHPLGQLVPERWLREKVLSGEVEALAGYQLERAQGTVPRKSVKDVLPAFAVGTSPESTPTVVAMSVGVDLDLVPLAADAREQLATGSDLVILVPERDAHPATRRLAGLLCEPARVMTVSDSWREPPR